MLVAIQLDPSMYSLVTQAAPKVPIFGHFPQILKQGPTTCDTNSRPPPLSLGLILCVVVPHIHRWHPPKFWPDPQHHDGTVMIPHCARTCCLLGCWLLAKLVRSTLDTKDGYKTKIPSTSSVTPTRIEYWDRAGGGRNVV